MNPMTWLGAKLVVAFDAGSVSGATLSRRFGAWRLKHLSRVLLERGALVPSPVEANLVRRDEVQEALARVLGELGGAGSAATLILPDGLARAQVFDTPQGVEPGEYARFRLAPGLPFPAGEAVVDAQPLGRQRCLGVAVRRGVVESYEALAAAVRLDVERVDLAPIAALAGLLRTAGREPSTVDLILGDAALSLAAWKDGALRVFRSRRRDSGADEAARLGDEATRTATLAGDGAMPRVRVVGPGATALVQELRSLGARAEPGWAAFGDALPCAAADVPWLGLALA
jgi:hypothetical protein